MDDEREASAYGATLGTLLRRLVDHLDGAVEEAYRDSGLDYRPRYTPIVRLLSADGPCTLRALSDRMGVSHSAVSQTVSQMVQKGLVELRPGDDARERIVRLTLRARRMLPRLEAQWAATEAAARSLDAELGYSLPGEIVRALELLEARSFAERIREASDT